MPGSQDFQRVHVVNFSALLEILYCDRPVTINGVSPNVVSSRFLREEHLSGQEKQNSSRGFHLGFPSSGDVTLIDN